MKDRSRSWLLLPVAILATALVGCSGAPDAGDVASAMEDNIHDTLTRQSEMAKTLDGDAAHDFMHSLDVPDAHEIDISDVAIQSSKEMTSGDYQLEVTYQARVKDVTRRGSAQVILGKRDGKWTVLN